MFDIYTIKKDYIANKCPFFLDKNNNFYLWCEKTAFIAEQIFIIQIQWDFFITVDKINKQKNNNKSFQFFDENYVDMFLKTCLNISKSW